jgi:thiol-disulfide isomerase/thioredoxin
LVHFLNKYASSKVVGEDKVYVHIAENYYCKGLAPWTEEEQLAKICDNARRLKPILIGKKARDVKTKDKEGTSHNLYDFDSEFTILYFWASDCGHCKKMTPFLVDFNEKYKSKGVSIMTICKPKSGDYKECWDYIDEHDNMENMLNTYDPSNRAQIYYNVRSTPSMFILNKDKEIIMKGIGADQLDEVMDKIIKREQQKNAPKE